MNYKKQLSFIISFVALRLLMFLLYMFFKPAQPGPYTPYILSLYTVFDILILCYLYRFVKVIKQQSFSLAAVSLVIAATVYSVCNDLFFSSDSFRWTPMQLVWLTAPANLVGLVAKIILSVQLIRNKADGRAQRYLAVMGWSFVFIMVVGFVSVYLDALLEIHPDSSFNYVIQLMPTLPWVIMIMTYTYELKQDPAASYPEGKTIDSEL